MLKPCYKYGGMVETEAECNCPSCDKHIITADGEDNKYISCEYDHLTMRFKCGCFITVWQEQGKYRGALSCCGQHDKPFAKPEQYSLNKEL